MSLYAQVAENLNNKGILPFSARSWNTPLVQSVAYGKIKYPEVMEEIIKVKTEMHNESINI